MSYSQSWLEDPMATRVILVHVTAFKLTGTPGEVSFYFSNSGYTASDGIQFDPIIANIGGFTESISESGDASMSFGDIELYNLNGELDYLLDSSTYIWSNRDIKIYYGDTTWNYSLANIPSTFLTIFNGVIDDIDSRANRTVNFRVRDKIERLNTPVSVNKIGTYGTWPGGQQNKDTVRPIVFGEAFNISPILIDPAKLEYVYSCSNPDQVTDAQQSSGTFDSNGASEKLIEIRDNGVPIYIDGDPDYQGATVDTSRSTFKLSKPAAGAITCSVQGVQKSFLAGSGIVNTYSNNIPSIIGLITTGFGKAGSRLSVSEIDSITFSNFIQTTEIGVYLNGTETVISVCQEIAKSVGAQLIISRDGKLRLIQFGVGLSGISPPISSIGVNDVLYDSLSISRKLPVFATAKIAYAKNYTIQNGLLSNIPRSHKESFETEWLTTTATNPTVATNYKLEIDVPEKPTYLISTADAAVEAARLKDYFSVQRTVYRFTGSLKLFSLILGQTVTLTHPRYGLSAGKAGQVISLSPNWSTQKIEVEVIV